MNKRFTLVIQHNSFRTTFENFLHIALCSKKRDLKTLNKLYNNVKNYQFKKKKRFDFD